MSKNIKQIQSLPVLHPYSAGIDIGASFHVVAIAPDLATEPVKTFEAFTTDLDDMAIYFSQPFSRSTPEQ